jgi:site-specific recombinase XerD
MPVHDGTQLGHDVSAVIADFLEEVDEGRVRDADGDRYARDEVRALRAALSHVASDKLGERDVNTVGSADIRALVSRLRDAGLPRGRVEAMLDALGSLYAYAIRRGLAARNPLDEAAPAGDDDDGPTPTSAMLTVTEHAVTWSVRLIVVCALLLLVALVIALG